MNIQGEEYMQSNDSQSKSEEVNLETLSNLTGFSAELIKKELFDNQSMDLDQNIGLEKLRAAVLELVDSTMLTEEQA